MSKATSPPSFDLRFPVDETLFCDCWVGTDDPSSTGTLKQFYSRTRVPYMRLFRDVVLWEEGNEEE